jgi:predicted methyltransferase
MKIKKVLQYAKFLLEEFVCEGDIVIDATVGNGHDTLFLANLVGDKGKVYGFDVQEPAIKKTTERLNENNVLNRVTLLHKSHEFIDNLLNDEHKERIKATIFNLGYLPGSDKTITTNSESTIKAINAAINNTVSGGIVILVIYPGHAEGLIESEDIKDYLSDFSQDIGHILQYGFINQQNNPPYILAIEKK